MTKAIKIILGLVGAAAAGVAIGILLAPEKGGDVRKKISDKASDIASRIGEFINATKGKQEETGETLA